MSSSNAPATGEKFLRPIGSVRPLVGTSRTWGSVSSRVLLITDELERRNHAAAGRGRGRGRGRVQLENIGGEEMTNNTYRTARKEIDMLSRSLVARVFTESLGQSMYST